MTDMEHLENKTLIRATSGTQEPSELALVDRVVGLYFSASWCPPCKHFTPVLAELYQSLRQRNSPFEVLYVSFDKTEDDMHEYMTEMHADWLALPHKDQSIEYVSFGRD